MKKCFKSSFINDCIAGKATPYDIDDYVERWHMYHKIACSLKDSLSIEDIINLKIKEAR